MSDNRSVTKFIFLRLPCMLALMTLVIASMTTLVELSKYGPNDGRTLHSTENLLWDSVTLPVVGFLFWKTHK
ncbi:hypothetical protein UFOVP785_42 [uncultured Caudovirales phage]|uniref:Uncharacterized protein n=1 Tax=uncultured Caudovirales phage TaxID=2100421 RepID=A0A6J5NXS1_9CAUD|nr:hypothetical protein UFOVP785_42 [uncultured Caudovirales phage]